jgi:hypothetical protein
MQIRRRLAAATLVVSAFAPGPHLGRAQTPEDERGVVPREYANQIDTTVRKRRPASAHKATRRVRYVPVDADQTPVTPGTDLGVTFWRLRDAKRADPPEAKERIAVRRHNVDQQAEMTPERADPAAEFADGELLRLSIEVPVEGYLYIIDRERYVDGTTSAPYLIFPSHQDVGTNDKGVPGRLLFVPNEKDDFELVRIDAGSPAKTAELFTVVLSPTPLEQLPPLAANEETRKLDPEQFASWMDAWKARTWRFEQQGSLSATITRAERAAGARQHTAMADGDALPQTVYHVGRKLAGPVYVELPIRIRAR